MMREIKPFTRAIGIAALVALSMTGCSPLSKEIDLASYQNQNVEWTECDSEWFIDGNRQSVEFNRAEIDCGTLLAPVSYASRLDAPDYAIAMMRMKASGTRIGTLFINPGGPGGSGIEELQTTPFPTEILDSFDIVGFDPRGVEHSDFVDGTEIKCSNATDFATYWPDESSPENDEQYLANLELSDKHIRQCVKDNPYWYTMTTANVVQDLELMRAVVTGDADLNFLGSSYGTTIAAAYVSTFPEHIGHIVLDSPTSGEPTSLDHAVEEAQTFEAKLMGWIKGYAKHSRMTVAEVKQLLLDIRQWGDDDLLVGFAGMKVIDASAGQFRSNENLFLHGIEALSYFGESDAQEAFNQAIDDLAQYKWNGNFEWMALSLDGYDPNALRDRTKYDPKDLIRTNAFEVMMIVNELDVDWPEFTDEEFDRLNSRIEKVSPFWSKLSGDPSGYSYEGDREYIDFATYAKKDPAIPDPPPSTPARTNKSGKGVLVVGSRNESVTPFPFAEKTAKQLKSPLVVFEGSIHAPVAGFDNKCLNRIFVDYLVHDRLPGDGTSCKP
jgi:pimeloyl-ACP methyl ester carboxylesterase